MSKSPLAHVSSFGGMRRALICGALLATAWTSGSVQAASREQIDAEVREAIANFRKQTSAGAELSDKAAGMLVFPNVIKAGIGVGGEYGEGALLVKGQTVAYYNIAAASIGFQLGAQSRSQIVLFMNDDVLNKFRKSEGWKAGVDGSVALASLGAGGAVDTSTVKQPIIGFIFSNKGLMYNLTFEGSKISQISK